MRESDLSKLRIELSTAQSQSKSAVESILRSDANTWWMYVYHELKRKQALGTYDDSMGSKSNASDKEVLRRQAIEVARIKQVTARHCKGP